MGVFVDERSHLAHMNDTVQSKGVIEGSESLPAMDELLTR
jgi:hypothetical protein